MSIKVRTDRSNEKAWISLRGGNRAATRRGIRQGFYFLGRDLMKTTKDGIKNGPKTGKIYLIKRGGRKYRHQASAPGEYPANMTGNLRRGVRFEVRGDRQLVFGAEADYAPYLERGTRNMADRPFLYKSIKANERNATNHFEREIKRAHLNET